MKNTNGHEGPEDFTMSMDSFDRLFMEELYKYSESFQEHALAPENVYKIIEDVAHDIFTTIIQDSKIAHKEHKQLLDGFTRRNKRRWNRGLKRLFIFINVSMEIGEHFNNHYRPVAVSEQDVKFESLVYLHSRGCLVANEIYCLLENGYADGALARWRTLHELAATAIFIAKHESNIARQYLEHETYTQHKTMIDFNKHASKLRQEPIPANDIEEARKEADALTSKYGQLFSRKYGWASSILPDANFAKIEENAGLDHLRPYYKWALKKIHAGHVAQYADLGTAEATTPLLLVGASNSGMTYPAQLMALSLLQISVALLGLKTNLDAVIYVRVLTLLEKDIGSIFFDIEQEAE